MKKRQSSKSISIIARTWSVRLAMAFIVPLFLIGSVEGVFRLVDYGSPVSFFVPSSLLMGSWSMISSWINVKLCIISIDAPSV